MANLPLPDAAAQAYSEGYNHGYNHAAPVPHLYDEENVELYLRAWLSGREDRREDDETLFVGGCDPLTEEERMDLYGEEDRISHYRG